MLVAQKLWLTTVNIKKAIKYGLLTVPLIYFITITINILLLLTKTIDTTTNISNATQIMASQPNHLILGAILIFTSIFEEIVFRGLMLQTTNKFLSDNKTIIVTALVFALFHLVYMQIYVVFMAFITGLLFAYIVFRTRNLYSSITAHVTYNMVAFIFMILF